MLLAAGVLASHLAARGHQPPAPARASLADAELAGEARRLLSDRCFTCHGPDAAKRKAKLRLDLPEGLTKDVGDGLVVVAPGNPDGSELIRRIDLPADHDDVMPPADAHLALSAEEKALLRRWVVAGAPYRGHWSWEPIAKPLVPGDGTVGTTGGQRHPIDAFVRARLSREGLRPSPVAAPETLVRRVAFALTGLPPTPDEILAFAADPSPEAYGGLIDRYLASPAYGERMAADWLDLARYADTYGYQADVTRDMSPWRDWVIGAFNRNLPYDQFLTWQLAGDLLPNPTHEQRLATAFNRLHRQTNEGGSIEEEFRTEYVADRVNTFGTAMLGLTLECARCHDHKFDPITQRDYFSLFAFFNSIDESGLYSHFTNATPSPSMLLWPSHDRAAYDAVRQRLEDAEARTSRHQQAAREAFRAWLPSATFALPRPIAHVPFDVVAGDTTPDTAGDGRVALLDGPRWVAHPQGGGAVHLSGDNAVVLEDLRHFSRTDPFSIVVRLKPTERQARAVVLHQSRAWTDAGSRGFELTLDEGRPFVALIHFWPGNAIAIRARDPLPLDAWSTVTMTYDGSSRAAGIRLYVDARAVPTEVVRDRLYKDILYDAAAGDIQAKQTPLTIGARFRDSGFRNGLVDDLRVFDLALTEVEVAGALPRAGDGEAALAHFVARSHGPSRVAAADVQRLRIEENRRMARVPELMVMEELPSPRPAHLLARGAYDAPREVVDRATPASLPPFPADQPRNRLGLARWLTAPGNPLAARVAVNRIWRMHFGRGLVPTVEDLGTQGRLPTHPDLLDWLAGRFVESGWDVKALHRLILTSDTFRQSSTASRDLQQRDPDNALLARGPAQRLAAEFVRDAALAASGLLVRTVGGPSVKPYQPSGLWEQSGTGQRYVQDTGDKLHRRSLYTFWRRTLPPPSMTAFDAVSREVCVARRDVTATPLQALVLLNDPQFVEAARVLAEQVVRTHPADQAARHRALYLGLVGREPDTAELAILARALEEQRQAFVEDEAAARALLAVGERPRDDALSAIDVAATTNVATLIMNLDAFVMVR